MLPEFVPHDYQEGVIQRWVDNPLLAMFLDPGLGKTLITLEAFRRMREDLLANRMLVVAPLRPCYTVWPREVAKWRQFADMRVAILHGPRRGAALRSDSDVYVINPEGLSWLRNQTQFWQEEPTVLALDESHKFQSYTTQRSRNLRAMYKHVPFPIRSILTGTPATNSLEALHGQYYALDGGERLGTDLKTFRVDFGFVPVPDGRYGHKWKPSKRAIPRLVDAVGDITIRLRSKDHLDLPELVVVDRHVTLPPKAREVYERFREEMVVSVAKDATLVALSKGTVAGKCRQIADGVVYVNDDGDFSATPTRKTVLIHKQKAQALAELWDEVGHRPMLVSYEFLPEVELIRQVMKAEHGFRPKAIQGDTSAIEGDLICEEWNAGNLPMLLVHPQTVAHGLNLQAGGHHLCLYSVPWDAILYNQLMARLHRQGQESERVMVHRLVSTNTTDDKLCIPLIEGKIKTEDALSAALMEA